MKLPKLSLRDLFWLVLVCALAVGWWVERARATELREVAAQAERYKRGMVALVAAIENESYLCRVTPGLDAAGEDHWAVVLIRPDGSSKTTQDVPGRLDFPH